MSAVTVEVVLDPASTEQGAALIRLVGVFDVPRNATFRIEPIDDEHVAEPPKGWPSGELTPKSIRIGALGVELLLGPEVLDAPALLPGTPVAISVPVLSLRRELRWPNLPVQRAARRPAVVVSGEQRAADIAARAEAQRAELARITSERQAAEAKQRAAEAAEQKQRADAASAAAERLLAETRIPSGGRTAEDVTATKPHEVVALVGPSTDSSAVAASDEAEGDAASRRIVPPPLPSSRLPQASVESSSKPAQPAPDTRSAAEPTVTTPEQLGPSSVATTAAKTLATGASAVAASDHDGVSAGDILARQVSKREAPSRTAMSSLLTAFGAGCAVAGGLAYLASLFMAGDETSSRRRSEEMARQLMVEAEGLRQRLATETSTRQNVESDSARRIAALEAERQKLAAAIDEARQESELNGQRAAAAAESAAAEIETLKKQLAAAEEASRQARASRGGAVAEVEAEAGRQRLAATEAKRQAEASAAEIEDLKKQLATVEEARRQAERDKAGALGDVAAEAKRRGDAESARVTAEAALEDLRKKLAEAEPLRAPKEATAATARTSTPAEPMPTGKSVSLRVKGSDFEVSGELKSFDGQRYVIESPGVGAITLDAARVTCTGPACPPPRR